MKYDNDKTTHHICGDIEYLTFNKLDKYMDKISYGIFLKKGGVSTGIYNSLNFRLLGNDNKDNIFCNVEKATKILNISNIYKACQTHSDNILVLNNQNKDKYEVHKLNGEEFDSYIHKENNIASLITTADCTPVIIYDTKNNIIANVHSGWAGTLKKIALKTAIKMHDEFNSNYEELILCLGPSIQKCCFTTEDETFANQFPGFTMEKNYITEKNKNNSENNNKNSNKNSNKNLNYKNIYHMDLPKIIKQDFLDLGVKESNIILSNICTCCNSDDFYSYRKFKKQGYEDYATFGTITMIK